MDFWGLSRKLNRFTKLTVIGTNFFLVWLPELICQSYIFFSSPALTQFISFIVIGQTSPLRAQKDFVQKNPEATSRSRSKHTRTEGNMLTLFPGLTLFSSDLIVVTCYSNTTGTDRWFALRPPSSIKTCTVPFANHRCAGHPCCSTNPFVAEIKTRYLI